MGYQVLVVTPSMTGKLDDLWTGPYIIAEKMNEVTYKVHTLDRKKKSRLFHVNGIKACHNEPVAIMSSSQREDLQSLHSAVFDTSPGHTEVVEHRIKTGDGKPVYHPPYRMVQDEVQTMLEAGIIVPSSSPRTSPLVPVRKKDGSLRLCVDYRRLNQVTQEDRYPMSRVEELLEQLHGECSLHYDPRLNQRLLPGIRTP